MDQFDRMINHVVVGKAGPASKTVIFSESEFDEKLAPSSATIDYIEGNNGEVLVKMTYPL
ncbi:MAG: hypothetical protein KBT36_13320 [Kurthia sp.]|nr:hypothetical protein [Candidatus Kurthia equi]